MKSHWQRFATLMLIWAACAAALPAADPLFGPEAAAWADDDDDDDDDDDRGSRRDRDDDRARPQRQRQARPTPPVVAPPPQALPLFAPEIVVRDLSAADLLQLLDEGFALLDAQPLPSGNGALIRLAAPPGTPLDTARDRVRLLPSGASADLNHFYRSGQDTVVIPAAQPVPCAHDNCAAWRLIGWPQNRGSCQVTVPVGVVDTGVNLAHDVLQGANITLLPDILTTRAPSGAAHGTAVMSLLVGNPGSRVPGLIPEAQIMAVDVFSRVGADERADVVALLRGLDALAASGVRIVNLSLSGPENTVLAESIARLRAERGMIFVAAAGNAGPEAGPAFPAALPGVVAVTAVDNRGRPYRNAQRGPHLDAAAPGVNLLAATSVRGAASRSGTSFAVPFVTAALALELSRQPQADAESIEARVLGRLRDLGAAGPDEIHGGGLLSVGSSCG